MGRVESVLHMAASISHNKSTDNKREKYKMDITDKNPYTFIDSETNQEFVIYLTVEDFQRAERDLVYATEILNNVKNLNDKASNENIQNSGTEDQHQDKENRSNDSETVDHISNSAVDDDNGDTDSLLWSRLATLNFLSLFKDYEEDLSKGRITQKTVFDTIAKKMSDKRYFVTAKQCASKMTSLKRMYKKIKDHNGKSGNDRRTWQYFAEVDEIFGKKPWVEPLSTASSTPGNNQSQASTGANQLPTENSRKRKIEKALEQYFDKNLNEKREQRAEKLAQHREKMAKLDQMNELLNNLIQFNKK